MKRIRMQHRAGDPMRELIEQFNKLRNDVKGIAGAVVTAEVIADQNGKNADGSAAVEA